MPQVLCCICFRTVISTIIVMDDASKHFPTVDGTLRRYSLLWYPLCQLYWHLLANTLVRSAVVVIDDILTEHTLQMPLTNYQ